MKGQNRQASPNEDTIEVDLLVLGSGMAGMTAAYAAAKQGARVIVVEKASKIGGSAVISGAHLWTARSYEQLRDECPDGDPALQTAYYEAYPSAVELVQGSEVEFSEELDVLFGRGRRFDVITYVAQAAKTVERSGGMVATATETDVLIEGEHGEVTGAVVRDRDGRMEIRARRTVLATGGFQGNRGLLEKYMGDMAPRLLLRSNPYSTGDGLRLAEAAGGMTAGNMATFYGHLMAAPLPEFIVKDFVRFALLYSTEGMLLNTLGERFTSEWLGDHINAQRVAEQPQGRAVIVFDQRIREGAAMAPIVKGLEAIDTVSDAAAVGARTATSETLNDLGQAISAWGYDGSKVEREAHAFRQQSSAADSMHALQTGPFHAVEVRPGITFTQGGICIDPKARVLRDSGEPIPGLFAAGADTGGVFNGGYAGGLGLAASLGWLAVAGLSD